MRSPKKMKRRIRIYPRWAPSLTDLAEEKEKLRVGERMVKGKRK